MSTYPSVSRTQDDKTPIETFHPFILNHIQDDTIITETFPDTDAIIEWIQNQAPPLRLQLLEALKAHPSIKIEESTNRKLLLKLEQLEYSLFVLLEFRYGEVYIGNLGFAPILGLTPGWRLPKDVNYIKEYILAEFNKFDLQALVIRTVQGLVAPINPTRFSIKQQGRVWCLDIFEKTVILNDGESSSQKFTADSLVVNLQAANSTMNESLRC